MSRICRRSPHPVFAIGLAALLLALPQPGRAEAPAEQKPAAKTGPLLGPALFDKKKPIEITSDRLDVDQGEKVAIFEGKVDAIQGEIHLRADRLKVYYDTIEQPAAGATPTAAASATQPAASAAPPAATAAQPAASGAPPPAGAGAAASAVTDPSGGGKIRRMDVDGHVFVSSPTETASGEKGVYNAETGKIVLTGDVILTRGGSVIHGTKLAIDVDSGKSTKEFANRIDPARVADCCAVELGSYCGGDLYRR